MDLAAILCSTDAHRARRTLGTLARHRIRPLVLTGGLAVELHCLRRGQPAQTRPLNDIDFLADSFYDIPKTLGAELIFRHVHPHDPPGRILLQCADPETAVRVDIFRGCEATIARAEKVELCGHVLSIITLEDLLAHTARACMDLAGDTPVPAKHARDVLRLLPLVDADAMDPIWQEHRKPSHPAAFRDAAALLTELIATRQDLLIVPVNSRDAAAVCPRCDPTEDFPLSDAARFISLLGYC